MRQEEERRRHKGGEREELRRRKGGIDDLADGEETWRGDIERRHGGTDVESETYVCK